MSTDHYFKLAAEHFGYKPDAPIATQDREVLALAKFMRSKFEGAERAALTSYIIASAGQYSHGSWDGTGVAEDMLKGAGIKAHEIRRHESDPYRRKRLLALIKKP